MDDFTKLCANEFTVHVERLFESERSRALAAGKKYVNVPFLDDLFPVDCEPLFSHYKRMAVAALSTQPCWLLRRQLGLHELAQIPPSLLRLRQRRDGVLGHTEAHPRRCEIAARVSTSANAACET